MAKDRQSITNPNSTHSYGYNGESVDAMFTFKRKARLTNSYIKKAASGTAVAYHRIDGDDYVIGPHDLAAADTSSNHNEGVTFNPGDALRFVYTGTGSFDFGFVTEAVD